MALVPSYIQNLANYVPGKPIEDVQRKLGIDRVIKLASNENSLGPSPRAISAMKMAMEKIHRYPDSCGFVLRNKLAKRFDVSLENVVIGAGSEGIISTVWESDNRAKNIANSLLSHGIIVRYLDAFDWPNCIRISVGLNHENKLFIRKLKSRLQLTP